MGATVVAPGQGACAGIDRGSEAHDNAAERSVLIRKPWVSIVNHPIRLDNGVVSVHFDLEAGTYSIQDGSQGESLLTGARIGLASGEGPAKITLLRERALEDELGKGQQVILALADFGLYRHSDHRASRNLPPQRLYSFTLYDQHPAVVLGFGLKTPTHYSLRLRGATVVSGGALFEGRTITDALTLNGAAGAEPTLVQPGLCRTACNSLMLTGRIQGERRTVVWGGLGNQAFAKVTRLKDGIPELWAEDPIGVLVDEEQEYWPADTFYLDLVTREPFAALERYGQALRRANHAAPQVYDFPVLCGWSVGAISKLPGVNTSAKLVEEADHAKACGLSRYTPVALRLEPDKYHFDTEQGWWDDEHFRQYGHLVPPYETLAQWCAALQARNGVPYIYMQLGMPSDDFARAHPQYMLFNDASEVDRRAADAPEGKKHHHHLPFVTYDYTDEGFGRHFVEVWSRIRQAGVRGVKIDYPATAWRPEGGFEDRYASTNAAYRRAFELLRRAMGPDGLIDERNLGEAGRPCLDVTAGLVDTQRTWSDSNQFVPEMISRSGLRWYKNRVVFNYYSDTKAVHDLAEPVLQALITLNFITSGRLDLATSFSFFTPAITRIVSRSYPHYREAKTARPLDAFTGVRDPQVYDLELTADWHQIALFNTGKVRAVIATALSGDRVDNAIGLDPQQRYHAYAFWSDTYLGQLSGADRLARELEPQHCEMISLRRVQAHPQVISTNRHLLQGWVDLADVHWDADPMSLRGTARVVGGEPWRMVIAGNGARAAQVHAEGADAILLPHAKQDLCLVEISASQSREVRWTVVFQARGPQ